MSQKNKGKTWEEILGEDGAKIRREKQSLALRGRSTSNKGKKWEDIYSPEEVLRRKEEMKKHNPFHKMSDETLQNRNKKISDQAKKRELINGNIMAGKNHSDETKQKISNTRKEKFKSQEYHDKYIKAKNKWSQEYFEQNKIEFTCLECKKTQYLLPSIVKCGNRRKIFCSKKCMTKYFLCHNHFKYKANGWENYVISLGINTLKYTGDHSFWITMKDNNGKYFYKNPDFIVNPFSKNKKVIEIWGKRWHTKEEMDYIKAKYADLGIDCLLLTNINFTNKNKALLKEHIERWIQNVI